MPDPVHVVDHPLVQHKLTLMRKKETSTAKFRTLLSEISSLLAFEVTRDLPLTRTTIETPMATMEAPVLDGKKVVLVGILRAGIGLLDGMIRILPSARVGYVGLYRNEETLQAVEYYISLPADLSQRDVLVLDPMLATGNTAVAALDRIFEEKPRSVRFVSLVSAPEGIARVREAHPEARIFTAAVDERLDENGYILPGLGDAGDRLFGTKQSD